MDGHLVVASVPSLRTWQTPRSFSIDVSSIENDGIFDRRLKFLSPRCYKVVFCVPTFYEDLDGRTYTKWYRINIRENGPCEVHTKDKTLSSFWDGKLQATEGFAALGSHVYAFGGPTIPNSGSDLCKLDLTSRGPYSLKSVPSMISPKFYPHAFAIDGKIYVFSSVLEGTSPIVHWGEVFDPDNGKWEALPDPPYDTSFIILSAALENPSRILVAFHVPGTRYSAMFYTYNVQHRFWEMLARPELKIHPLFPTGCFRRTITAHNTLYWATYWENEEVMEEEAFLIAYNLDTATWLEGSLKHLGFFSDPVPCLLHLENKRFCLLQTVIDRLSSEEEEITNTDIRCVVVDISHIPGENKLGISLVWEEKYNVDSPFGLSDGLLLP